jgi:hypothetical protein
MLHWDERVARENVKERLRQLPFSHLGFFAVGCLTHAQESIACDIAGQSQIEFSRVSELLARFWREYPESMQLDKITPLARDAAQLLPEDQGGCDIPWEDALVWGLAHAFSVVSVQQLTDAVAKETLTVADRSYVAVYLFYNERDEIYPTLEEVRPVELSSYQCLSELSFQVNLLRFLELTTDPLSKYSEVVKRITSG